MTTSLPICENMTDIWAVPPIYHLYYKYRQMVNCSCLLPCHYLHYFSDVRPAEEMESDEMGVSEVWIYFAGNTAEVLIENHAYDIFQMMGEFGGCLGMFLGISLVSLYEFLDGYIRSKLVRVSDSSKK